MKKTEDYYSVYYGNTSITSNVIYSLLALATTFCVRIGLSFFKIMFQLYNYLTVYRNK